MAKHDSKRKRLIINYLDEIAKRRDPNTKRKADFFLIAIYFGRRMSKMVTWKKMISIEGSRQFELGNKFINDCYFILSSLMINIF